MQLFRDMAALCHRIKQPGRRILGMAGHKAEQIIPFYRIQPPQEPGKIQLVVQILAV